MICERCKRRFGIPGKSYWTAEKGICPFCEDNKNKTYVFYSMHHQENKHTH